MKPTQELIEKVRDNELHRINIENNLICKLQGFWSGKRQVHRIIRQLLTLYRNHSVMQLEYPVSECLKHPSEFVFAELNLN